MVERRLHTRESLLARRGRRRRVHLRRRAAAVGTLALLLVLGLAAIRRGGNHASAASVSPAATLLVKQHAAVFPKRDRVALLPYVAVAGRHGREIALTFDDGPGPYTLDVVRTLHRLHAPGTFFQVGTTEHFFTDAQQAELSDPLVTIGDHTQNHRRLDQLSRPDQGKEIDAQAAILRAAGAPAPTLFRPPYGAYDASTLALLRERRMTMVMWSVDSEDYRRPGVDAIVANVLSAAKPGAIVLLHDAGGDRSQTIAALPRIVKGLRDRHYTLVSVPRLLHDAPPPLKQPVMGVGVGAG
jgi:peptidoglycan/xylan/chitin deacetylase (PgdA/CDA1 family)